MITRRTILASAVVSALVSANQALAKSNKPSAAERFDTDHDGTVDLAEAKKAATETFNKLDTDKDGTLDLNPRTRTATAASVRRSLVLRRETSCSAS